MKIERFEDLDCWKEARKLVNEVYSSVKQSTSFQKDFRLVSQITDAAVSSMSNIAEGFSRKTDKEFIQFLFVAKGSATEVQSEAYVALDQNYVSEEDFNRIYKLAENVNKLCSGLITYLKKSNKKTK